MLSQYISFEQRLLCILNQCLIFLVSIFGIIIGMQIYYTFLTCNWMNQPNTQDLQQHIKNYGLTVIATLLLDFFTIPLSIQNIITFSKHKLIQQSHQCLLILMITLRASLGSWLFYKNLSVDELAYMTYITVNTQCIAFAELTQDLCDVLENVITYANYDLPLAAMSIFNVILFVAGYYLCYKETVVKDIEICKKNINEEENDNSSQLELMKQ